MNEWLKNMVEKFNKFWKEASTVKKAILFSIVIAIIAIFIVVANVSSSETMVPVFSSPISQESDRIKIQNYCIEKGYDVIFDAEYRLLAKNKRVASEIAANSIVDGVAPSYADPYEASGYYNRGWSTTDAEQNVKQKQAAELEVKRQIESISDVSNAAVVIVIPEDKLFSEQQEPVSASVILTLKRGSTLAVERNRIKGLQSIILSAVPGLTEENLKIGDNLGNILNDFEGMKDFDRLTLIEKQQKMIKALQADIEKDTLEALQKVVGKKRIGKVTATLEMDFSERKTDSTIYTPIEITPQDPTKPYDTRVTTNSITISRQSVNKSYEGTSFNPEGPAGVEGQNPPTYQDMSNMIGKTTEEGITENNVVNTTHEIVEFAPKKARRNISAFIDGIWSIALDENGNEIWEGRRRKRICTLVPAEEIKRWIDNIFIGTGCDEKRGDSVTLTCTEFNHDEEFRLEDEKELKAQQTRKTILLVLGVIAVVLVGFILFRVISKKIEEEKRRREEEALRKQQAEREKALWEAKDDANMAVSMSVEESRRAELLENASNLAKEHPEEVALLIRTWLMEE